MKSDLLISAQKLHKVLFELKSLIHKRCPGSDSTRIIRIMWNENSVVLLGYGDMEEIVELNEL